MPLPEVPSPLFLTSCPIASRRPAVSFSSDTPAGCRYIISTFTYSFHNTTKCIRILVQNYINSLVTAPLSTPGACLQAGRRSTVPPLRRRLAQISITINSYLCICCTKACLKQISALPYPLSTHCGISGQIRLTQPIRCAHLDQIFHKVRRTSGRKLFSNTLSNIP